MTKTFLLAFVLVAAVSTRMPASRKPQASVPERVKVCSLLTKEEVKKYAPWLPMFDGKLESVPGVGDEAYLYENPNGYAELYAKIGGRLLTIQRDIDMNLKMEAARPGVVGLAQALAAKLR